MPTLFLLLTLAAALFFACADLSSVEFPTREELQSSSSYEESSSSSNLCADLDEYESYLKFCDERDGKIYSYVKIDNLIWMAQNLNYDNNESVGLCYKNIKENCDTYGRLYNWEMVQGICPDGWRIPKDSEFNTIDWSDKNDFVALPGGIKTSVDFSQIGYTGYWWSDSKTIYYSGNNHGTLSKTAGYYCSVRCVKG